MPFQLAIQFYIDNQFLTEEEVLALTTMQVEMLSTPFMRAFIEQGREMITNLQAMRETPGTYSTTFVNDEARLIHQLGTEPIKEFVRGRVLLLLLLSEPIHHQQVFKRISSGIQQGIDEGGLTLQQALNLPLEKLNLLKNSIVRGLITHGTHPLTLLRHNEVYGLILIALMRSLPQRATYSLLLGALFTFFMDRSAMRLIHNSIAALIAYIVICDLVPVLRGRLTLEQAVELPESLILWTLDPLEYCIEEGLCSREQVLSLNVDQLYMLKEHNLFIATGTLTFEQLTSLTSRQANSLWTMMRLADASQLSPEILDRLPAGVCHRSGDLAGPGKMREAVDKIHQSIIVNHLTVEQILNLPDDMPLLDNRINALLMQGRMTFQQAHDLTDVEKIKLQNTGVYYLISDGTLTVEQVLALTVGQCYQLNNPAMRARVVAGDLNVQDIVAAEIADNVPNPNIIPQINNAQSTHTASIHRTVSESATRLFTRYGCQLNAIRLAWVHHEITTWVNKLPESLINTAAKDCMTTILPQIGDFTDPQSRVNIRQLLALSWLAIHDDKLRAGSLEDAQELFCAGLYEIRRGYNIDENGKDNNLPESQRSCDGGGFNKFVEKLVGIHPDAVLEFITPSTAGLKLRAVVKEEVMQYLSTQASPQTAQDFIQFNLLIKQIKAEGIECIWDHLKDNVTTRMFSEFDSLYPDGEQDSRFIGLIHSGQYVNIGDLSVFQKELSESAGYGEFVQKSLSRFNTNFFHRTENTYLIENRHAHPVLQHEYDIRYGLVG